LTAEGGSATAIVSLFISWEGFSVDLKIPHDENVAITNTTIGKIRSFFTRTP